MKIQLRINPPIGIFCLGLLLTYCSPGQPTDGREEVPTDVVEEAGNLPVEVDTTEEDTEDISPPPLPDNGIVQAKGSLSDYTQACGEAPCTCETVTLARVQTKDHTGWSGGLFGSKYGIFSTPTPTYDTDIHYELGDSQSGPQLLQLRVHIRTLGNYTVSGAFTILLPEHQTIYVTSLHLKDLKSHPGRERLNGT